MVHITLEMAALIAKAASDAVNAFDNIYDRYANFLKNRQPRSHWEPPPDYAYVDAPDRGAIVAMSRSSGKICQTVSYEELSEKLSGNDADHIKALSEAMTAYEQQWNSVYRQKPLMSDPIAIAKVDQQLERLAEEIGEALLKVLNFLQSMGLFLDDHYNVALNISKEYLEARGKRVKASQAKSKK